MSKANAAAAPAHKDRTFLDKMRGNWDLLLFCLPGCAHGGGKGRGVTGSPCGIRGRQQLVDWCERGKAPEDFSTWWAAKKLSVPVPPYPGLAVQMPGGRWKVVPQKRGVVPVSDICRNTKVSGLK